MNTILTQLPRLRTSRAGRCSSWDTTGRNDDRWMWAPGETKVIADIRGPGMITHIWMTGWAHYRECLLRFTWDDAPEPSVLVPLGDFFGLGHGMVNSYQSLLFSASTATPYRFDGGCAHNCYAPMPFRRRATVELVNESSETHAQYFYVDYETFDEFPEDMGYFHAEFRRVNPFGGWAPGSPPQSADVANVGRKAWNNNYVILDTRGRGHYIGCNLSVTNFHGGWWGEGDDMIWVDGYKWPPDLHGTGSEDYLGHAYGMQASAFLRNGSSIHEPATIPPTSSCKPATARGGYQTSYIHHIENPVPFTKSIKVTIEHGHANHLANEMSSVAYWYAEQPAAAVTPPPVKQRLPILRDNEGNWIIDPERQCPGRQVRPDTEMKRVKARWAAKQGGAG